MSREKQISDMQNLLWCRVKFLDSDESVQIAEALYNAGYRKATDVAAEIFAEIQKSVIHRILNDEHYSLDSFTTDLDALKKKYTGEGK